MNILLSGLIVAGIWLLAAGLLFQAAIWVWRRQTRHELPQSDDAYRHLVANITHDISNPLQNVLITLENLAAYESQTEDSLKQQYYEAIRADIDSLVKLTEEAKLLAQLDEPQAMIVRERVNLERLAADIIFLLGEQAEQQHKRLTYQGVSRPPYILGDKDKLKRVLFNLVENAIKYTSAGEGEIVIKITTKSAVMTVSVSDNGLGIASEHLADIWTHPFVARQADRVHIKGTGLGLAIARRVIAQHGGTLQVNSVLGQGTTFFFDLPIYQPTSTHQAGQAKEAASLKEDS